MTPPYDYTFPVDALNVLIDCLWGHQYPPLTMPLYWGRHGHDPIATILRACDVLPKRPYWSQRYFWWALRGIDSDAVHPEPPTLEEFLRKAAP